MGSVLSKMEEKEMTSYLQGIQPASLASIVWDTINSVGVDDESEKFGISFEGEKKSPKVMFWDNGEVTEMPRKVFLEILEMMSGRVLEAYETEYNIEESPELKSGVDKLKLAKTRLQKEIESLRGHEGAKDYRKRLDSIQRVEDESKAKEMVQEVRQRRGSMTWSISEDNLLDERERRLSNKGLEGVVDRLPDLRRKYEDSIKRNPFEKVRKKIIALGLFGSKINPDNRMEDEEMLISSPPEVYTRRKPLTMLASHHESHSSQSPLPEAQEKSISPEAYTHTIVDVSSLHESYSTQSLLPNAEQEETISTGKTTTLWRGHTILDVSSRQNSLRVAEDNELASSPSEISLRRDSVEAIL
ncbi:uncharacterized protein LOC135343542 [Halichondria panicea]|uniref:uncharacterized protein LOC135343542 n=1 Tax=Halichondria panicea TaxID=6063 RepID=UPI00312B641F